MQGIVEKLVQATLLTVVKFFQCEAAGKDLFNFEFTQGFALFASDNALPLLAAAAMSGSALIVIANAMRLRNAAR